MKPEYDKLVSNFAFNFNLRRYTVGQHHDGFLARYQEGKRRSAVIGVRRIVDGKGARPR
jgi:hypothetical protein